MSIATRIENMSNNINKTYNQAKALGADLTNIDKNLGNLPNILGSIYNNYPKTPIETGTSITLNNTAKGRINMELTPQTSQETTTGAQLYNIKDKQAFGPAIIEEDDDWITCTFDNSSGTSSVFQNLYTNRLLNLQASTNYNLFLEVKKVSGTGNITITNTHANSQFAGTFTMSFDELASNSVYNKIVITKNNADTTGYSGLRSYFNFSAGQSGSLTFRISVLEDTSIAPETFIYQPFTGGIPSPNPNYPQEIHRTTGDNQVKVVGKNLFDINNANWQLFSSAYPATYDEENKGWYNHDYMVLAFTPKEIQTLSFKIKKRDLKSGEFNYSAAWELRKDNAVVLYNTGSSSITFVNINYTMESGHTYSLRIYNHVYVTDIQLEQSSSATSFTPYEETTYPISLGNKEMYNINNIADGFVYDENMDKFYINRNIGKVILNGSESGWVNTYGANLFSIADFLNNYPFIVGYGLSNYYKYNPVQSGINAATSHGEFALQADTHVESHYNIFFKNTDISSVDNWKSWLSTHNTSIIYQLLNSTLEEITDTILISQLRAIKDALSMQDTTYIISTSTGENLPFIIKANALLKNSN